MSDELQRLPDWAFNLLQTTEDENREERHMAKLQAEASLQRAKNKRSYIECFSERTCVDGAFICEANGGGISSCFAY